MHPVRVADRGADGAQAVDRLTALLLGEGAQGARDDGGGGDHVDRGAGGEHAGAAHAVGALVGQPLRHRPQAGHQVGRRLDHVAGGARDGAVATRPRQRDAQGVGLGHGDAVPQRHHPGGDLRRHVEADQPRSRHEVERAALDHPLGPAECLLGRLEEEDEAARQFLAVLARARGPRRGATPRGHRARTRAWCRRRRSGRAWPRPRGSAGRRCRPAGRRSGPEARRRVRRSRRSR